MKKFIPTPEMVTACENYILSTEAVSEIKPKVILIQRSILEKNKYPYDKNFHPKYSGFVLNPAQSWMIDAYQLDHYYRELNTAYVVAGFEVEEGYCPLLIAEDFVRKASNQLIESVKPITKVSADMVLQCGDMDMYKKMVETAYMLLFPFVNKDLLKKLSSKN